MKKQTYFLIVSILFFAMSCENKYSTEFESYDDYPVYEKADLGLLYTPESSVFKIWSPVATNVKVHIYDKGLGGEKLATHDMQRGDKGLWELTVKEDLEGKFYTFQVTTSEVILGETPGIYAKAVGVNGMRAAVIDMGRTNPEGWQNDKRPVFENITDAVIYELHVKDITSHPSSGSSYPGKFIGLVEPNTSSPDGLSTGIDHMKEMGITHVHILPAFDFRSLDETKGDDAGFNWGYDPQNYNVPEGTYASDPADPYARIREFKQMVKGFHDAGIRVIMDVVYNHTGATEDSNFNLEVPGYYYRHNADGTLSDASACGNETASDRSMMRKYIMESVKYWAEEYHVDGFRFDLMAIHDIETMNEVSKTLEEVDPTIMVYGEGWTAGSSPLADSLKALKHNTHEMYRVAAFSDDMRDGLKGSVFEEKSRGFVSGAEGTKESIKFGVVGASAHPQVNYEAVNYSNAPWSGGPDQCVNYVSCHDNQTLFDKLMISTEELDLSGSEIKKMHKLANAIVLTAQGVPFLHAGVEMMRTKGGEHNSYNLPDSINQIRWTWKSEYKDVVEYYKNLIRLRKEHPAFRMSTTAELEENLVFMPSEDEFLLAYTLDGQASGDDWSKILVVYNANKSKVNFELPDGDWRQVVKGDSFDFEAKSLVKTSVVIPGISMAVFAIK
ncbi:MAG TPA: type I pullulanase [Cytophagales bacterium]|jgi:pullulanase|nr:type I pullulanase [Cytophagales bacterium]